MKTDRSWTHVGLDETVHAALARGMPATQLWSLLLGVIESRASQRAPAAVSHQWRTDRFVTPSYIDQRTLNELDAHLLAAASEFEAIELSPLAPLGTCASVARTTQNRIVSTTRGTEVVADPSNVLAFESARRLREDASQVVRLATSHRCVRAQEVPATPGFAAHFRMFCMTTAGRERADQMFRTDSILHHIRTHLNALTRLEAHGYSFPSRSVRLLATSECEHLSQRIAMAIAGVEVVREPLNHGYYDGLRFMISARSPTATPSRSSTAAVSIGWARLQPTTSSCSLQARLDLSWLRICIARGRRDRPLRAAYPFDQGPYAPGHAHTGCKPCSLRAC